MKFPETGHLRWNFLKSGSGDTTFVLWNWTYISRLTTYQYALITVQNCLELEVMLRKRRISEFAGTIFLYLCIQRNLLVKGKLTVMFEKNPSGGYLTKGSERDGVMTRVVPGGRARRPSEVTHSIRFWRECGTFPLLSAASVQSTSKLTCKRCRIRFLKVHSPEKSILKQVRDKNELSCELFR